MVNLDMVNESAKVSPDAILQKISNMKKVAGGDLEGFGGAYDGPPTDGKVKNIKTLFESLAEKNKEDSLTPRQRFFINRSRIPPYTVDQVETVSGNKMSNDQQVASSSETISEILSPIKTSTNE